VGEPGRFPDHHPDARSSIAPAGQLLDPTVVEYRRGGTPVLDEDLGEFTPCAQRRAQDVLEEVSLKKGPLCAIMSLVGHWLILSGPQQAVTARRISRPPERMRIVQT
jgi:hypothetical protein